MSKENWELVALLSLFVVVGILFFLKELKRGKDLRALAARLNMDYSKKWGGYDNNGITGFRLFCQGDERRIRDRMARSDVGIDTTCFEYIYVTGDGERKTSHHQTVVSVSSDAVDFPSFILKPEGLMGRLDGNDINFDNDPTFSKMFHLKGRDEEAIRNLFNGKVIRFFENHKGITAEARSNRMILYRRGRRCSAKKIEVMIKSGLEGFELLRQSAES